jgi:hypothetical protein
MDLKACASSFGKELRTRILAPEKSFAILHDQLPTR